MAETAESEVFEVARAGDLSRLQELVVNEPSLVEAWSADGFTPLHLAVYHGHEPVAETLLRHGAALEAASRNDMSVTPLHSAAASGHRSLVSLLLTYGADANARQAGGRTALHTAAGLGDLEMVKILLEHHAEPNLAGADGRTALEVAREEGHEEVVKALQGWTPGDAA